MSLEKNKIAGAVLGTLVFAMGIGFVADLIFDVETPEKSGFEVAVAESEGSAPAGNTEPAVEPIAVRLARADAAKGESLVKACQACHVFDQSNANKAGPGLWNIVNRKPGSHEGFGYSAAMVEFGASNLWDYEHLDAFIANPKAVVAGTKMAYAGMKKPDDRAALIAYLRTLSESPAPLPEASATPAAEAPAPADTTPAQVPSTEEAPAAAPQQPGETPTNQAPAQ